MVTNPFDWEFESRLTRHVPNVIHMILTNKLFKTPVLEDQKTLSYALSTFCTGIFKRFG